MNIFLFAAGLFLMVLGAVELIRWLSFWLYRGARQGGKLALIVMPQGPESCEALVRTALRRVEWMELRPQCRLICLQDQRTQEILSRLMDSHPELEACVKEELIDKLS